VERDSGSSEKPSRGSLGEKLNFVLAWDVLSKRWNKPTGQKERVSFVGGLTKKSRRAVRQKGPYLLKDYQALGTEERIKTSGR